MNYLLLFLAVAIGYVVALGLKTKEMKHMSIFLAFSGAFLLSITVFELLPDVFSKPANNTGVYIMGGILLQIFLEFFSKGAEHGHIHLHSVKKSFPWMLFLSLSVHAFLEGFPIADHNHLLLGVMVHKIPVAIILSYFFIQASYKRSTTLTFLVLFGIMTPLGNWIGEHSVWVQQIKTEISAVVIGIFLHVSTTILFESSKNHTFNLSKMTAVVIAIALAYFL